MRYNSFLPHSVVTDADTMRLLNWISTVPLDRLGTIKTAGNIGTGGNTPGIHEIFKSNMIANQLTEVIIKLAQGGVPVPAPPTPPVPAPVPPTAPGPVGAVARKFPLWKIFSYILGAELADELVRWAGDSIFLSDLRKKVSDLANKLQLEENKTGLIGGLAPGALLGYLYGLYTHGRPTFGSVALGGLLGGLGGYGLSALS